MRNKIITAALITALSTGMFTIATVFAQSSDPPPPPGGHGTQQNQLPGGGVPLNSGLVYLIALGIAYSGKKVFGDHRKNQTNVK
ncbi:MAG TPA: hypothetical protein PLI65_03180 [Bacteroidales bacterium]|nr:hypothetical protein [Bacteroidales bacterium]